MDKADFGLVPGRRKDCCGRAVKEAEQVIRLGLPKGSLQEATLTLFARAGWRIIADSRSYQPIVDDPQIEARFIRAQEMSRYVEHGFFDVGLTGYDWIVENGSDVVEVCDLVYSKATATQARWVLAVPEDSPIREAADLEGKLIATEVVNITRNYLKEKGVKAEVEFSWGATEVKVPELADAIVELTESGSSLRANKLRVIDTLLQTNTKLIANKTSWEDPRKRSKIENMAMLLQAALAARNLVGLKLNAPRDKLEDILAELPALRDPTISPLSDEAWVALETVVEEKIVREIIPALKNFGAEGIIEYPLNKVVY